MNRDPYVAGKENRRVQVLSHCRGCRRPFTEVLGDGCDGFCPICNDEPSSGGYQPAWDHSDDYFR